VLPGGAEVKQREGAGDMKKTIAISAAMTAMVATAVTPTVSNVEMSVTDGREVTVTYDLANGPAVITLSVETNSGSSWIAMDDKVVSRALGDVNRKITGTAGTITFVPEVDMPTDTATVRAKVTAWPMDDTPDYMVYSLAQVEANLTADDRVRYYASTNALPGGLLGNIDYRMGLMVFRKIKAAGVTYTMGSDVNLEVSGKGYENREAAHKATLYRNYYLAVFPLTQGQYRILKGADDGSEDFVLERYLRIKARLTYNGIRGTSLYPAAPNDSSLLGIMRQTSGRTIDFDLPSEAEWEYACRAGYGHNYYGTGVQMRMTYADRLSDPEMDRIGRYRRNQASEWYVGSDGTVTLNQANIIANAKSQGVTNGVPIAGSYAPNVWGLYDMLGGVMESCLDWYQEAESISAYNGAVNANGANSLDGASPTSRVRKGGSWGENAFVCRPAYREGVSPGYVADKLDTGLRVKCYMGLRKIDPQQ